MTSPAAERQAFGMAPLIRFTLLALYAALALPLPWIAPQALAPWLWGAFWSGWLVIWALTSERVVVDGTGLQVGHPAWCSWCLRRGWQLSWRQVGGLTPVATSQGGRVYYVRTGGEGEGGSAPAGRAYLLPQRVERFEDFLARFSQHTGIPTSSVARITPPWTYQLLAAMSGALLAGEVWTWAMNR